MVIFIGIGSSYNRWQRKIHSPTPGQARPAAGSSRQLNFSSDQREFPSVRRALAPPNESINAEATPRRV